MHCLSFLNKLRVFPEKKAVLIGKIGQIDMIGFQIDDSICLVTWVKVQIFRNPELLKFKS